MGRSMRAIAKADQLMYKGKDHKAQVITECDKTIFRAYEMGVSDYINRPFDANIVYQRVSNTVKLYAKQRRLMAMVTRV